MTASPPNQRTGPPDTRPVHGVAVVVFVDAAVPAEQAAPLGTSLPPECARCHATPSLDGMGLIPRHVPGETWAPEDLDREPGEPRPEACPGSDHPPHVRTEPVIAYRWGEQTNLMRVISARDVTNAGRNGDLVTLPTPRAFRGW